MLVKLTQDHINDNRRGSPCMCALAQACTDAFGKLCSVALSTVCVEETGVFYRLPSHVEAIGRMLDRGYVVEPLEFELIEEVEEGMGV